MSPSPASDDQDRGESARDELARDGSARDDQDRDDPATAELAALVGRLRAAGCVFAEREAALLVESEPDPARREPLVVRRVAGEPLEYVVGWAEFLGHRFALAPGVFVPRHRSELLVRAAVERGRRTAGRPRVAGRTFQVVDVGCGTGALGISVARRLRADVPGIDLAVHLTDVDEVAVACARTNLDSAAELAGPAGTAYVGDLADPLPASLSADLLIAHLPYVPTERIALMPPEARDHEALATLDGGADGLDPLRRVVKEVVDDRRLLAPGGVLLTECARDQEGAARTILERVGLVVEAVHEPDGAIVMVACHAGEHDH